MHLIKSSHLNITGFSDSNWALDPDDRHSTSGYCVYFGNNLISWSSKKQTTVSRSSIEAKYMSLAHATVEVLLLKLLVNELHIHQTRPPTIWVDNLSTIFLSTNPVLNARTKHVEIDLHFIREKIISKSILVQHIPSHDQIADILTKPLSFQSFTRLRNKLQVFDPTSLGLKRNVKDQNATKHSRKC